ncbi:MAG: hypothetical protein APU95_03820 [Hadesarchaea archaeon YNP_N21]|jgi:hypothetical protein|nr:MAG: hypothetical protein APU95_03820 [Hadesarchaea archaeon YNP_N21]
MVENMAKVFSFDIKFKGSRRTTFYRKLFGFSYKIGPEKRTRSSPGILEEIPYLKLGKSVIAVPQSCALKLKLFFSNPKWQPIELHVFDAILPPNERMEAMNSMLNKKIKISKAEDAILISEINRLRLMVQNRSLDRETIERIRRVLREAEELKKHDWTDGREFSSKLDALIEPLRKISG